ncbi:hypothetical protein BCR36DRAFT_351230 [Piromyces finnis]|uniref:Uncharacterized protein n=1 Tax=Piromyces finnis TaxID=1754191 RepID=A0A1Y1VAX1_9FUNG|nr:hypothetical protein BCR36DRAFT_351230 [Piromyces finnis]|eukprot:ORX51446.1 hypothetical protein BCR36DRAFT_351230 [Piromyces finnis]
MEKNILLSIILFYLIINSIKVNASIKFINNNIETFEKRETSSIFYEIYDANGNTDLLSYSYAIKNYDISITSSMNYHYNLTQDTTYNLKWESSNKCEPIYEENKKIAVTTTDDLVLHNCYKESDDYTFDILNIKNLYDNVINLPELLIVQFNDIYDIRVNIYIHFTIYIYIELILIITIIILLL